MSATQSIIDNATLVAHRLRAVLLIDNTTGEHSSDVLNLLPESMAEVALDGVSLSCVDSAFWLYVTTSIDIS